MSRSSVIAAISATLCLSIAACAATQDWDRAPAGDAPGVPPTTTVVGDVETETATNRQRPTPHTPIAW